ncbi:MAG: penicillin-binding protein 1A [Rhodospirillaceae bacterium]|nr:MAG: penicillin-binding protein 1A [Rhodospirillaceae bacterium]
MRFSRFLSFLLGLMMVVAVCGAIAGWFVYKHFSEGLPDYYQLASYDPPLVTRVQAGDGRLLQEYAVENRVFVPIGAIPKRVINAFLAAEDKSFYSHPGIDIPSVLKAAWINVLNYGRDRRPIGASTITQQVTKNFLLTNEVSYGRKIKEAILALRIEKAFSKNRILELYLNQIYLGSGNYGVAAAALNYFNKSLDELTVGEAAYLASLPKAPNNYNIKRNHDAAKARRDWVIDRMLEDGHITAEEDKTAKAEELVQRQRGNTERVQADYFAEEVRRELLAKYGEDGLYKRGLSVRTSVDPELQADADRALRKQLVNYDRTQGYRGPLRHLETTDDWQQSMAHLPPMPWLYDWKPAIVLSVEKSGAKIGLADGSEGTIPTSDLSWARRRTVDRSGQGHIGPAIKSAEDVFKVGDIVAVEPAEKADKEDKAADEPIKADGQPADAAGKDAQGKDAQGKDASTKKDDGVYALRQVPELSGAFVAMDPHTGRVLALSGGWSYELSEFNRATQAMRQVGSSFKPIVYLAALEAGYTPSTIILDAPIVIDQGPGLPLWKPENFEKNFLGPATMREGLEHSRNLMTIRLAQTMGMKRVAEMAGRLGVADNLQQTLAMSIGAGESTLLRMVNAYSMIVNGGKKVTPSFVDRVQDNQGWTIYRHDDRPCDGCLAAAYNNQPPPQIPDTRPQVLDPVNAYQMVSMMEGVVQRGTGSFVKAVGKPLAGKTGTTNDGRDVWFIGFSPDLAAGVYLGFDQPRSLGRRATGGLLSAPVFRDFMIQALKDKPATPFRVPPGVRLVRVNYKTGQRPVPGDSGPIILEAFKPGTEPTGQMAVIEGNSNYGQDAGYGSIIPLGGNAGPTDSETTIIDSGGSYSASQDETASTPQPGAAQPETAQPGEQPAVSDQPAVPATGMTQQQQQPNPMPPVAPAAPPASDSSGGLY